MREKMTKRERFQAVLKGELPDRPPITAYLHNPGREYYAKDLSAVMLEFQRKYDWDIMKIHPSGVIMQQVWGHKYDYEHYVQEVFPSLVGREIHSPEDIGKFTRKSLDEPPFRELLEGIRLIKEGIKEDLPIFQTLFTPINIFSIALGVPPVRRHIEAYRKDNFLFDLIEERPDDVHQALENITATFVAYVEQVMHLGIDGFFYAGIGYAREGYMTLKEWETFVKPYDIKICEAIRRGGGVTMFHTCGMKSNPQRFVDYPIEILHWDQGAGNPSIKEATKWLDVIVPMGGLDEMLFGTGAEEEILQQSLSSLEENKAIPYIFAPYCSVSPRSSEAELKAFRNSVDVFLSRKKETI